MASTPVVDFETDTKRPDDMSMFVWSGMAQISFFTIFVAFILYVLLDSTFYNNNVLARANPAFIDVTGGKTPAGVFATGLGFGIILSITEAMHRSKYI